MDRMLTVTDIARICDVAPTTVRAWNDRGLLPEAVLDRTGPGKPALSWSVEDVAEWIIAYHRRTGDQIEALQRRHSRQKREIAAFWQLPTTG